MSSRSDKYPSAHTREEIEQLEGYASYKRLMVAPADVIASVHLAGSGAEEAEANARLFANAWKLFDLAVDSAESDTSFYRRDKAKRILSEICVQPEPPAIKQCGTCRNWKPFLTEDKMGLCYASFPDGTPCSAAKTTMNQCQGTNCPAHEFTP
jgi:hypothetical protein